MLSGPLSSPLCGLQPLHSGFGIGASGAGVEPESGSRQPPKLPHLRVGLRVAPVLGGVHEVGVLRLHRILAISPFRLVEWKALLRFLREWSESASRCRSSA